MIPRYKGHDPDAKRYSDEVARYLKLLETTPSAQDTQPFRFVEDLATPLSSISITTSSNITVGADEINAAWAVTTTAAIDVTIAAMEVGDWIVISSDSASSNDLTVKNPSAATIVTLEAGDSVTVMKDASGVYFAEGVSAQDVDWTSSTLALVTTNSITGVNLFTTGTQTVKYTAVTSGLTLGDHFMVDCTANSFTVALPTAIGIEGIIYHIKNSGTGTITLDPFLFQLIDGEGLQTIETDECISVVSDNANWLIF